MSSFREKLANITGATGKNKQNEDVDFLLKTIDEQNEQIARLQSKFRDVTHAYKGLLSEKKALEITLKALKTTTASQSSSKPMDISEATKPNSETIQDNLEQLNSEDKIAALTSNVQVLVESKGLMEQNYMSEKKKMRDEIDELKNYLKQTKSEKDKLIQEITKLKSSTDQDAKNLANEQVLLVLRNENNELKGKHKNLTKQFENKCEEVVQREKEYKQLKVFNEQQTKTYEERINQLNDQLHESNKSNEIRVSELESQISEMCLTIASQKTEQPEKIKQKPAQQSPTLDFDSAIEQISQLKTYVESTARDLNINFNFNEIWLQPKFNQEQNQKDLKDQIEKLREENRQIREEFEKHKIRTNYLIKTGKQPTTNPEPPPQSDKTEKLEKTKEELNVCKKRIVLMERQHQEELKNLTESNQEALLNLGNEYKSKIKQCEADKLKAIADLENELRKQHERTMQIIAEKDTELNQYRDSSRSFANSLTQRQKTPVTNASISECEKIESTENDPRIIHYTQQAAYKETELTRLRLAKNELEYRLKQIGDEHSVDIDRLQTQIGVLKQEIERIKLNDARVELNGANLEYIKNVIFNFMTTKDANVKQAMSGAITHILQFSKSERQRLQSCNKI